MLLLPSLVLVESLLQTFCILLHYFLFKLLLISYSLDAHCIFFSTQFSFSSRNIFSLCIDLSLLCFIVATQSTSLSCINNTNPSFYSSFYTISALAVEVRRVYFDVYSITRDVFLCLSVRVLLLLDKFINIHVANKVMNIYRECFSKYFFRNVQLKKSLEIPRSFNFTL